MHSIFSFKYPVYIFPCYFYRKIAISAMIIFVFVQEVHAPPMALGKSPIHPIEHPGKIFRIIAPRPSDDREYRIAFVIFVSTFGLCFQILEFFNQRLCFIFISPKICPLHSGLNFPHSSSYFLLCFHS